MVKLLPSLRSRTPSPRRRVAGEIKARESSSDRAKRGYGLDLAEHAGKLKSPEKEVRVRVSGRAGGRGRGRGRAHRAPSPVQPRRWVTFLTGHMGDRFHVVA